MSDSTASGYTAVSAPASTGSGAFRYIAHLLGRREMLVLVSCIALLAAVITATKIIDVPLQRGDSAIFFQATENIATRGIGASQVFANTRAYQTSGNTIETAAQVAEDPLRPPAQRERNILQYHAYYILYLIAPLVRLFPPSGVLLTLHVLSYLGLLLGVYVALRRRSVPVAAALLFCLLIMSHPAWSQGLLYGQFFPDRLFLPVGFAFMCLLHRKSNQRWVLLAAAILCMLVGERAAIVAGLFTVLYMALYWKQQLTDRYFKLGLGIALLAYGEILLKVVLKNSEYGSFLPRTIGEAFREFSNPVFAQKTELFLAMAAVFLILSLFNWRGAVIAIALMLPNVFGNIGGAEKVGWASNYHVYYLPSLIWAAMLGYEAAFRLFQDGKRYVFYVGAALLVLMLSATDPVSFSPVTLAASNLGNNFVFALGRQVQWSFGAAGSQALTDASGIRSSVPRGAVVSTVEEGMPLLYRHRTIRFLPMGVDEAGYVLMYFYRPGNAPIKYYGVVNFLGDKEQDAVNAVVVRRMKRDGYDFRNEKFFPANGVSGMVLIKRRPRSPVAATSGRKAYIE